MGKIVSAYPKNNGEKVFYCPRRSHSFSIPRVGTDGKRTQLTNVVTGALLYDTNGDPLYKEDTFSFKEYQARLSEDGYWCVFVASKNTPKTVVDFLEKCVADRSSEIVDEKEFLKITNPDLYQRVKEDKEKDDQLAAKDLEIEELRSKLSSVQGKRQQ